MKYVVLLLSASLFGCSNHEVHVNYIDGGEPDGASSDAMIDAGIRLDGGAVLDSSSRFDGATIDDGGILDSDTPDSDTPDSDTPDSEIQDSMVIRDGS